MVKNQRDIEFLFEIGSLRNVERSWRQFLGMECANIPEHTFRVVWLALILARMEGVKNEEKIMKMALVHDLVEARTGDLNPIFKVYASVDEDRAIREMFQSTALEDFYGKHFREYVERKSKEAQIVKDADTLDVDLELWELKERGSKVAEKVRTFRKKIRRVREKHLHTKSAKQFWDLIQKTDSSSWYFNLRRWFEGKNLSKKKGG